MGNHGPQAVGGDGGGGVDADKEQGGSYEREGKLGEHLFHYSLT